MKKGKKFTAALLCIMMMLTMMPAMAFADDPVAEVIPVNITNPSQATNNNVVLQKSLEQDEDDGTFTITMESYATGRVTVAKNQSTDFVIVLDQSGSMDDYITVGRGSSDLNTLDKELGATAGFYVGVMDGLFSHEREIRYNATTGTWQYYKAIVWPWESHWKDIGSNRYDLDEIGIKKIDAAKVAVKNFIDATATDNTENSNTHRIAAVGFSSTYTEYGKEYDYSTHKNEFTNGFELASTTGLRNKVIGQFDAVGGTYTDVGMEMAQKLLNDAKADTDYPYAERGHVVIVLTDGDPGLTGGVFDSTVANNAIGVAKDIKAEYDATDETKNGCAAKVYTIGLDLKATAGSNVDKFVNYLSSNYPTASDMNTSGAANTDGIDYYSLVNDAESLNNIFKGIAEQEGGISSTVTLDTNAILTDTVNSNVFVIPDSGIAVSDVKVYTSTASAAGWGTPAELSTATVTVDANTVTVNGFNYTSDDNVVILDAQGNPTQGTKLIVKITGLELANNILADGIVDDEDENLVWPATFDSNSGYAAVKATADGDAIVESLSPSITGVPVEINYYYDDEIKPEEKLVKYSIEGATITHEFAESEFGVTKAGYDLDKVELQWKEQDAVVGINGLTIDVYYISNTVDVTYKNDIASDTAVTKTDLAKGNYTLLARTASDFAGWTAIASDKEFKGWKVEGTADTALVTSPYNLQADTTFVAVYGPKEEVPVTVIYKQPSDAYTGTEVKIENVSKTDDYTLKTFAEVSALATTAWVEPTDEVFKGWKVEGTADTALVTSPYNLQANTTFVAVYEDDAPQDPQYTAVITYHQYGGGYDSDYPGSSVNDESSIVTVDANGDLTVSLLSISDVTGKAADDDSLVDWDNPSNMKFNGWKYGRPNVNINVGPVNPKAISTTDLYNGSITISKEDAKELAPNGVLNLDFTANYEKKGNNNVMYYTLDFESNGGSHIDSITASGGSTIDVDKYIPTKKGYDFKGWYYDEALKNPVGSSLGLTSNMTIYAKWSEKTTNDDGTPSDLNSKDHIKYVVGYPDGYVRPNNMVTRAETASMLYRLLTDERRAEVKTFSNNFSDVSATAWYVEPASSMYKGGYIAGYQDGTFGGDRNITRAEFVSMLVRFIGTDEGVMNFTDVPQSHWAYENIAIATAQGWISGYSDGTFKPDQAITRAEAMSIINRVLNRGVNASSTISGFKAWPDNYSNAWYYYDVIEATNSHDYTGERPSENWSSVR